MRLQSQNSRVRQYFVAHQLQRDTLFGFASTFLRGISTVASSFFIVRSLGVELLGSWSFLLLLTSQGYLGLIDLGLHAPVTRQMAYANEANGLEAVRALQTWYSRRLGFHLLIALPLIAGFFLLAQPGSVSSSLSTSVAILFLILLLVADTALLPIFAQLEATSRFLELRSLEVAQRAVLLGFVGFYVTNWPSLLSMLVSHLLTALIVLIMAIWITRDSPSVSPDTSSDSDTRQILTDNLKPRSKQIKGSLAARFADTARWQMGRTLILIYLGVSVAGELEIITRYVAVIWLLMSALTGALFPRFVVAENSAEHLRSVLTSTLKWFLFVILPLMLFLVIFSGEILTVWFGAEHARISNPARLMLLTQVVIGLTSIFDSVLISKNRNEYYAFSRWIGVITTAALGIPLMTKYGLAGLMCGFLVASVTSLVASLFLLERGSRIVAGLQLHLIVRPCLVPSTIFVGFWLIHVLIFKELSNSLFSVLVGGISLVLSYFFALALSPNLRTSFRYSADTP